MTRQSPLIDDRGNATVLAVGIIAVVATLALALVSLIATRVDSHRAQVAADLAAVAGAFAHHYGEDGCRRARDTARLNDATVTRCHPEGADVVVTARVRLAEATARAGPL